MPAKATAIKMRMALRGCMGLLEERSKFISATSLWQSRGASATASCRACAKPCSLKALRMELCSMAFARERIKGSIPALITPLRNGAVDEAAFRKLVSWQIAEGSLGLVPCGTTGESPTLSDKEHMRVGEVCVEAAHGRVPVIAGDGST